MIASRCIFRLENAPNCVCGWGGGAHSALPDPLAGVGGGPPGKEGGREKGKGRDRKGEEGKGKRE